MTAAVAPPVVPAPPGRQALRDVPAYFWVFLVGLCLNVFSGHWKDMGLPIGPDRLLVPLAIVLAVLDPRVRLPRWRGIHTLMAAFVLWSLLSAVFHDMLETNPMFALLDRTIVPFVLFALAPVFLATRQQRKLLLQAFTLLGAYLAITTLLEGLGGSALVFPHYIATLAESVDSEEVARAGGPFVSGEANGMSLSMCAFSAALLFALRRGPWRWVSAVVAPACVVATVLTMTRSVWLGVLLGMISAALLAPRTRRMLPAALLAVVAVLGIGAALLPEVAENATSRGTTSRSVYDRENVNRAALRILEARPLTGVGWQRVQQDGSDWVRQSDDIPVTSVDIEVHNVFLSRAAELGIPAALVFIAIVLLGPVRALFGRYADAEGRAWRQAYVGMFCVWLVPIMASPTPYPFPNYTLWLLAGLMCTWATVRDRSDDEQIGETHASEGLRPQPA